MTNKRRTNQNQARIIHKLPNIEMCTNLHAWNRSGM